MLDALDEISIEHHTLDSVMLGVLGHHCVHYSNLLVSVFKHIQKFIVEVGLLLVEERVGFSSLQVNQIDGDEGASDQIGESDNIKVWDRLDVCTVLKLRSLLVVFQFFRLVGKPVDQLEAKLEEISDN